jgi:hypothetical protein
MARSGWMILNFRVPPELGRQDRWIGVSSRPEGRGLHAAILMTCPAAPRRTEISAPLPTAAEARMKNCLPVDSGRRRGAAVRGASFGLVTSTVSVSPQDWTARRVAQAGRVLAAGGC